jgi:ubiquinone/menaquinone biosynthesis C-methylase UbiE
MNTALNWIDKSNLPKKSKILDIGCGAGFAVNEVIKRGYKAFGIDYSFKMLEVSKKTSSIHIGHKPVFTQADLESLPFKNSSFDVVICMGVATYLSALDNAFKEFARVLKSNGILVLSIVNKARLVNRLDLPFLIKSQLKKIFQKYKFFFNIIDEEAQDFFAGKTYTIPYVKKVMRRYGFNFPEYRTIPLGLLSFWGREIPPRKLNLGVTMFFEKYINIPVIGSFGAMVLFKAKRMNKKNSIGGNNRN